MLLQKKKKREKYKVGSPNFKGLSQYEILAAVAKKPDKTPNKKS